MAVHLLSFQTRKESRSFEIVTAQRASLISQNILHADIPIR